MRNKPYLSLSLHRPLQEFSQKQTMLSAVSLISKPQSRPKAIKAMAGPPPAVSATLPVGVSPEPPPHLRGAKQPSTAEWGWSPGTFLSWKSEEPGAHASWMLELVEIAGHWTVCSWNWTTCNTSYRLASPVVRSILSTGPHRTGKHGRITRTQICQQFYQTWNGRHALVA